MSWTGDNAVSKKDAVISKASLADSEQMLDQFRRYSRAPFMDVLVKLMESQPDILALQMFAKENPDKWANTVQTIARLAGYHDKLEIEQNVNVQISSMADADLMHLLRESEAEIVALQKQDDGTYGADKGEGSGQNSMAEQNSVDVAAGPIAEKN